MDLAALPDFYSNLVPMSKTIGMQYVELTPERVVLRMPDDVRLHNHLGGPHAGAMFTLGETGSGLLMLINFADEMAEATPLPGRGEIHYKRIAKGDVTITATMGRDRDEILAEMREKGSAWFPVNISIATNDGETGQMTVDWNLKKN